MKKYDELATPYVEAMISVAQMDREIDTNKHYISPGGYEFKFGKESVQFDFCEYAGYVDSDDKTKILFESIILDTTAFPDCKSKLTKEFCSNIDNIEEFYIYTGEYNDPEIFPIKILEISLLFSDGTKIDIKKEVINKYNEKINKEREEDKNEE